MLSVDNNLFEGSVFSSLPELSPTIKRAALVTCGIAGSVFLGVKAYRYVRSVTAQRVREKVADYVVIGFTLTFETAQAIQKINICFDFAKSVALTFAVYAWRKL